jgi:hypothetical protein
MMSDLADTRRVYGEGGEVTLELGQELLLLLLHEVVADGSSAPAENLPGLENVAAGNIQCPPQFA